jgi:hypothetical protein
VVLSHGRTPSASGFALVMNITGVLARVFVPDLEAAIPQYHQDGPLALAADPSASSGD